MTLNLREIVDTPRYTQIIPYLVWVTLEIRYRSNTPLSLFVRYVSSWKIRVARIWQQKWSNTK